MADGVVADPAGLEVLATQVANLAAPQLGDGPTRFAASSGVRAGVDVHQRGLDLLLQEDLLLEVIAKLVPEGMFDLLTYEKGGSVLRMLEQYLGEEEFKDGISYYLNKHKYGNTETNDLWDAIEHVTQQPARRIMDSWIFQKGYPLVSASISDDGTTISLSQDRFLYTEGEEADTTIWSVPIVMKVGSASGVEEVRYLLEEKSADIKLYSPAEWATANAGGSGFCRARYSP